MSHRTSGCRYLHSFRWRANVTQAGGILPGLRQKQVDILQNPLQDGRKRRYPGQERSEIRAFTTASVRRWHAPAAENLARIQSPREQSAGAARPQEGSNGESEIQREVEDALLSETFFASFWPVAVVVETTTRCWGKRRRSSLTSALTANTSPTETACTQITGSRPRLQPRRHSTQALPNPSRYLPWRRFRTASRAG